MRSRLRWSLLILLVAFGVSSSIGRALTLLHLATPLTEARLAAARTLVPAFTAEFPQFEQHFADRAWVTLVHVIAGALFLSLGLLQFSPTFRNRHLRFHRRAGRLLVAFALLAGTTGLWLGVVAPFASSERLPTAAAGAVFLIAPVMAIAAIRRADVVRHREWMIRFFALGVGVVIIRISMLVIIWLLSPRSLRAIVGPAFWSGWIISLAAAELWIRSTRANPTGHSTVAAIRA